MKNSKPLPILAFLSCLLAFSASCAGLFWPGGGSPYPFLSVHGQEIQIYGRGLYRSDSFSSAATFIGTDAVIVFLIVPLLVYALLRWRRGSLRGGLLLVSLLGVIFYNACHMAFAAAYNELFLLYAALLSASLFALITAFNAVNLDALPARLSPRMPRRGPAVFLITAGTALTWSG